MISGHDKGIADEIGAILREKTQTFNWTKSLFLWHVRRAAEFEPRR